MNGPITDVGMAGLMMPSTGFAASGTYLAGDYPSPATGMGFGMGAGRPIDAFGQSGVIPMGGAVSNEGQDNPFGFADVPQGPTVRASGRTAASRRQAARNSSRRPTTPTKRKR
jgi:hypothetical protein